MSPNIAVKLHRFKFDLSTICWQPLKRARRNARVCLKSSIENGHPRQLLSSNSRTERDRTKHSHTRSSITHIDDIYKILRKILKYYQISVKFSFSYLLRIKSFWRQEHLSRLLPVMVGITKQVCQLTLSVCYCEAVKNYPLTHKWP